MPKREERDLYGHAFEGNPYDNHTTEEMYESLRWDNSPNALYEIDAPEPMATIGDVAKLKIKNPVKGKRTYNFKEESAPFLAVGKDSNQLYIVPKDGEYPLNVPELDLESDEWEFRGEVKETHYYSDKGEDNAYYYHEHQKPFPELYVHETGVGVLVPADNDGEPSYAVIKEGIIG
jgi:hypothetical protein